MNRLNGKKNTDGTTLGSMVSLCFAPFTSKNNVIQEDNSGNLLHWFPMRITYHREMRIKSLLDEMGIENFLPLHWEVVEMKNGGKKRMLLPAIHNLIFVRATQAILTELKMTREEFAPMRYMMKRPVANGEKSEIMHVPDQQMENFMRVASVQDDRVMFLDNNDFINKVGQRVKVIDGCFSGVEGVIKRINRNKHVVVQLEGLAAVAIAFVPASHLSLL